MAAAVVASGKATLAELKTVYTLEELFQLAGIIVTDKYNEWRANKRANKNR